MNFEQTKRSIQSIIACGDTPLVIGEAGIGKTTIMKEICDENDISLFTIDCTLIKEGDISGLPYLDTVEYSAADKNRLLKIVNEESKSSKQKVIDIVKLLESPNMRKKRLMYAPFHILLEINKAYKEDQNKPILLFIDELNRAHHEVQQEVMNLILQRKIHDYELPPTVMIVAAMNPSNKFSKYSNSNYQVIDFDDAQSDRMVHINMEPDITSWLQWGNREKEFNFISFTGEGINKISFKDSIIHDDIQDYLSSYPENLHITESNEDVKATPRSWERVSKEYYLYTKSSSKDENILYNTIAGNIGETLAIDFLSFVKEHKNPLMTVEEVFSYMTKDFDENTDIDKKLEAYIKDETPCRLMVLNSRIIKYMENEKMSQRHYLFYTKLIDKFPLELINSIYFELSKRKSKLWNSLTKIKLFIDTYMNIIESIDKLGGKS